MYGEMSAGSHDKKHRNPDVMNEQGCYRCGVKTEKLVGRQRINSIRGKVRKELLKIKGIDLVKRVWT
jgi:hypothetical protein